MLPSYTWTPPAAILARTRLFLRLLSPYRVGETGDSSGVPSGRSMPRDSRKDRVPSSRGLPSTYASYSWCGSKGTNSVPVLWARSERNSSNISFHAAACTVAVWVTTPSMSNRQARTPSGSPNIRPSAEKLCREVRLVRWNLQVRLGQFLDVDVLEGDYTYVLDESGGAVHIPHPRVSHRNLEEDLAVVA